MVSTAAKQFTVVFRCDASKDIGSGHVMRCLTLAKEIKAQGGCAAFQCSDETLATLPWLRETGFTFHTGNDLHPCDWLVVDHYGLDLSFETPYRAKAKNILVIDDLANRPHDADLLLDQTFGRQNEDYKHLVPEHCQILTGSLYALLRPEFAKERQSLKRVFGAPRRILVSYGGVNPKNVTEKALRMLQAYKDFPMHIDVVVGGQANGLADIKNLVAAMTAEKFHTAILHIDTPDIAALMLEADLCLGAGGTTSWERCCMGLPALAVELASNQATILENLDEAGALKNLGRIENLADDAFLAAFAAMISDTESLNSMSAAARKICDGQGAQRIAEAMLCV